MINCCKLCYFLSRVSYLSLSGFARDSCNFPCGKLEICLTETLLCFLNKFHVAFCPSSFVVLALTMYCSRASLWIVLRVVYDIPWFHSGKSSEFRSVFTEPSGQNYHDISSSKQLFHSRLLLLLKNNFFASLCSR